MSLERKIVIGFLISAGLIAVLAVSAAVSFLEIRRGIADLELSDTLRSKALLVRRHEKNFFLYGDAEERDQVHAHLEELGALLRPRGRDGADTGLTALRGRIADYRAGFSRIESLADNLRLRLREQAAAHTDLAAFLPLLEAALLERPLVDAELLQQTLHPAESRPLAGALASLNTEIAGLRRSGEDLLTLSTDLDRGARLRVEAALARSRNAALILIPLSLIVGLGFLFAVGRSVVSRLKLLTAVIEKTGKGDFATLDLPAGHDEVGVLVGAVNTMERELLARERVIAEKNEELLQSRKLAAIGTLASGVAHELNNPLNNISLAAQVLARAIPAAELPPIARETLDDILSQTQRVKRIVGDLLEFSREKPPDLRPTDLVAIVREAAARAIPPAGQVAFRLEGLPAAPVLADAHLMTQVFVNLIANAADAMGGSGSVTATVERRAGAVRVGIADSGRGIHPDDLSKVFDPFFTTKEHGTGLGLAIVYNTVRKHGGSVEVSSRLEHGTTFTVTLPGAEATA